MRSGSADGRVRRYRRARAGIPTNGCPETQLERSRRRSKRRISPTNYQSTCSINPDRINVTFLPENVTQSLKNATFIHKAKHSKAKHNEKPSSKVSLEKGAGRMPARPEEVIYALSAGRGFPSATVPLCWAREVQPVFPSFGSAWKAGARKGRRRKR